MRFVINIILSAIIFAFIIPHINGAYFHGGFGPGLLFGLLLSVTAGLIVIGLMLLIISTLGALAIPILLVRFFGFWLFPALELRIVAHFFPGHLGFSGWGPAILAGLAFMVANLLTTKSSTR